MQPIAQATQVGGRYQPEGLSKSNDLLAVSLLLFHPFRLIPAHSEAIRGVSRTLTLQSSQLQSRVHHFPYVLLLIVQLPLLTPQV